MNTDGIAREANRIVHEKCSLKIARLTADNARLREALKNAMEKLCRIDDEYIDSIWELCDEALKLEGGE